MIYSLLKTHTWEIFCDCAVNFKVTKGECTNVCEIELRKELYSNSSNILYNYKIWHQKN